MRIVRRRPYQLLACMLLAAVCIVHVHAAGEGDTEPRPFRADTELDRLLAGGLAAQGIRPAPLCGDAVFLRRAYLDLTGTLPPVARTREFLSATNPDKRTRLIEELLQHETFADYWTLKWCDILRVKAEYPINLWPNGVQAYARWIRDAVASNMPYDAFCRALLTSSGSNFRVPPVNFYRAIQGESPAALASAVALTFMGTRLDSWPQEERASFETIFSRVAFKGTAEWKETVVYLDPAPAPPLRITFPDGQTRLLRSYEDPRVAFADWLIDPDNEWFARAIVNRTWSWFFGRGLIDEADDIRPDNPAVHPYVLRHLEREFVASGYDMRRLFRIILTSSTYQQSSVPTGPLPEATRQFARYPVRRLDAEVLLDALSDFGGRHDRYSSQIPEPFTFIPPGQRTIALTDGSITSPFLKMFGRPARDTGLETERSRRITHEQRLHLINSSHVAEKLKKSWNVLAGKTPEKQLDSLYLATLCRYPTDGERAAAGTYVARAGRKAGAQDLLWAIINSKEFLYQH